MGADATSPGTPSRRGILSAVGRAVRLAMDFTAGNEFRDDARTVVEAGFAAATPAATGPGDRAATCAVFAAGVVLAVQEHDDVNLVPMLAESCLRDVGRRAVAKRRDFELLLGLDLGAFPGYGEPVDASEGGPLGPL